MKLTKRNIDALKPTGGDEMRWDDEVRRFGLRIKPSGVKSFLIQYRNAQGNSRKVTIGQYGNWTPEQARTEAKRLLRVVDEGGDPAAARQDARKALTLSQLCTEYREKCERGLILGRGGKPKKTVTVEWDKGRIDRHIVPLLGKKLLRDLTQADIRRFYEAVATGKTKADIKTGLRGRAIVTGGNSVAKRTLGLLGGILSYAIEAGHRDGPNPCHGLRKRADNRREFRMSVEEYRGFGKALEAAEAAGEHWQAIEAARLLALTGCRRDEIVKLKWAEVDFGKRCLRLGDTKTGASIRPLGSSAFQILEELAKRHGRTHGYVFPATRGIGTPYSNFPKAWKRVIDGSFTPRGLRHAFASTAHELGYSELTIAALLGHAKRGVTAGYVTQADRLLLEAVDRIAGYIWAAIIGESGKVITLQPERSLA